MILCNTFSKAPRKVSFSSSSALPIICFMAWSRAPILIYWPMFPRVTLVYNKLLVFSCWV